MQTLAQMLTNILSLVQTLPMKKVDQLCLLLISAEALHQQATLIIQKLHQELGEPLNGLIQLIYHEMTYTMSRLVSEVLRFKQSLFGSKKQKQANQPMMIKLLNCEVQHKVITQYQ